MAASRLDLAILREIVRIVQEKARVPEKVRILKRDYVLTYLEDHRHRMEEALRRFDADRVNMLFGQLASKVKYQLVRVTARREAPSAKATATRKRPGASKPAASPERTATRKPAVTRKRASQRKRTPRPQHSARPKRAAQPKRAARSRAAAARKLKVKKRTRSR